MYQARFRVDKEIMSEIRRIRRAAPIQVRAFVNDTLKPDVQARALTEMQKQPRQSPLPFVWSYNPAANARARRWYFANKVPKGAARKKRGRYVRTGQLVRGWKVLFDLRSATLKLTNEARGVEYVQGNRQVPSHKKTRWANADTVAEKEAARAQNQLIEFWYAMTIGER